MSRALSTVLDASMAILLVSAATVALATIPNEEPSPPDPDAVASTVLASTATATYQDDAATQRNVTGRASTLLAQAAVAVRDGGNERFVEAVEAAVGDVLVRADGHIAVVAVSDSGRVRVGERPPPSASVAAVSHEVSVQNGTATITVRTWSQ